MWVLARPPIDTIGKKFPTCVQSHLQIWPQTRQKLYPKFQNPRTTVENSPLCLAKYSKVQGKGEVPLKNLGGILIFWTYGPM